MHTHTCNSPLVTHTPQSPTPGRASPSPFQVLSYWSIGGLNKWADVGILAAMVFIYRALFWVVLVLKEKYKF